MPLSEVESVKQLQHMLAFIDQEACEKVEEIDAKTDEEFNIEKGRLVQQQRVKLMELYDKKTKSAEMQKKIIYSHMLNTGRLQVLKCREDNIKELKDDARKQLAQISQDIPKYKGILEALISQGLYQLLEDQVVIRCRQKDLSLVQEVVVKAVASYKEASKRDVKVTVDTANFLNADLAGGVELLTPNGKIKIENTLESRLELMAQQMLPAIREILFGANPNRKFLD